MLNLQINILGIKFTGFILKNMFIDVSPSVFYLAFRQ
jgi:hypothetical protein